MNPRERGLKKDQVGPSVFQKQQKLETWRNLKTTQKRMERREKEREIRGGQKGRFVSAMGGKETLLGFWGRKKKFYFTSRTPRIENWKTGKNKAIRFNGKAEVPSGKDGPQEKRRMPKEGDPAHESSPEVKKQ